MRNQRKGCHSRGQGASCDQRHLYAEVPGRRHARSEKGTHCAHASRDYQDVHHDSVLAKERGSQDIFMNILTTNGLVGRYVTDWSGPRSRLSEVNIRLGAPNHPDCIMTLTGSVTEKGELTEDGQYGAVTVSLRGANDLGDHVTGTVEVLLPVAETAGT